MVTQPLTAGDVLELIADIPDPEIPVISISDLGILRNVAVEGDHVTVTITPTYSGCPALDAITQDIETTLEAAGIDDIDVAMTLSPAWTTDWMSAAGKRKLLAYGIAPPSHMAEGPVPLKLTIRCPQCGSGNTGELSRFGSTSCKSLWQCRDCREPFDSFKVH